MTCSNRRFAILQLAALSAAFAMPAVAETSVPPLRLIVPLSPGSMGDTVARRLAIAMSQTMKRAVVVENLPDAGGMTGTSQMVRAAKDGNTLALVPSTHVINPSIYKNMPFDSIRDVSAVAIVGDSPGVVLVNPGLPVKTLPDLIALAKSKPGQLNYGSSGNGTNIHLMSVMLTKEAGIDMTHIPYKGNAPFVTDLVSGQVQVGIQATTVAAPFVKSGQLRPIAVTTKERSRLYPDVPTLQEQGLPAYDLGSWMAILAPAGLPEPLLNTLNQQINAAMQMPDTRQWFESQDFRLTPATTPASATAFLQSELVKHTRLVRESGAVLE